MGQKRAIARPAPVTRGRQFFATTVTNVMAVKGVTFLRANACLVSKYYATITIHVTEPKWYSPADGTCVQGPALVCNDNNPCNGIGN